MCCFWCHSVKRDRYERLRSRAVKGRIPMKSSFFHAASFQIPSLALLLGALQPFVFLSSGSDLKSTTSASAVFLPARRLPVISSRPGPRWDDEARVFRPNVDPGLISCLAAEARASAVYNLRLSGCSSTAAVGLQLSSCCCPSSCMSPRSTPREKIACQMRKKWEAERAAYSHEESVL